MPCEEVLVTYNITLDVKRAYSVVSLEVGAFLHERKSKILRFP